MHTVGPEDYFFGNLERIISEDRASLLRAWRTTGVQREGWRGEGEKRCGRADGHRVLPGSYWTPALAPVLQGICLFRSVSLISLGVPKDHDHALFFQSQAPPHTGRQGWWGSGTEWEARLLCAKHCTGEVVSPRDTRWATGGARATSPWHSLAVPGLCTRPYWTLFCSPSNEADTLTSQGYCDNRDNFMAFLNRCPPWWLYYSLLKTVPWFSTSYEAKC